MKKGSLSSVSVSHGVVSSKRHQDDVARQHLRKEDARRVKYVPVEVPDGVMIEPFCSDVSAISAGRNWAIGGAGEEEMSGDAWVEKVLACGRDLNWYHQKQSRKGNEGYYRRKIKDRQALGRRDKRGRMESDLSRFTVDLRPDHSRALEKILRGSISRSMVEMALDDIRREKIRLFELIYGRRVEFCGEHPDSGQYHHDLWHSGISEKTVGGKVIRERVPFRSFGVGVGVAAWDRHQSALGGDAAAVMGETLRLVERNAGLAEKQNGEPARDLRFNRALDEFVGKRLRDLAPKLVQEAGKEYEEFLRRGYQEGKLGAKHPKKETSVGLLRGVLGMVAELLGALARVPGFSQVLKASAEVSALFHGVVGALSSVGVEVPVPEPEPEPEPEPAREKPDLKALTMEMEKVLDDMELPSMGKGKRRKKDTPSPPSF